MPKPAPAFPLVILLLATALLSISACDRESHPREVTLGNLAGNPVHFVGKVVITEGMVHGIVDPRHYWIEDEFLHRVALKPADAVADLEGSRVRVTGVFHYTRDEGRFIVIDDIQSLLETDN